MSRPFTARCTGVCVACDELIRAGDRARYLPIIDGPGTVHDDCATAEAHDAPEGDVCPSCFLRRSLSGECGCAS